MGYSRWDASDWSSYSAKTTAKPAAAIFRSSSMHADLNPLGVVMRESRDSDVNPNSTALIAAVDVTGSMGMLADYFIKTGLGILFQEVLDRKPISDPHLMFMAVGDVVYDRSPLQVSQFEADISIADQLEKVHIEKGGGGNDFESYDMPWYFAAYHTSIDCFEKRNKKGYLFTIGDEPPPSIVQGDAVKRFVGDTPQADIPIKDMYEIVSKMYHTYHIIVTHGRRDHYVDSLQTRWADIMGQHAIILTDHTKLSEVITSIIEVQEGRDADAVTASWSGDTSLVVAKAISGLKGDLTTTPTSGKIVRF